jgi:hypothetical protein
MRRSSAETSYATPSIVMPGLVPGIHVFLAEKRKAWMAGTSPAMTEF